MKSRSPIVSVFFWLFLWLGLTLGITLAGGILGMILFTTLGPLFVDDLSFTELLKNGVRDGSFYAFLWAPGLSIVACVMHAAKLNKQQQNDLENKPSGPA